MVAVERVGRYFDHVDAIRRRKREEQIRIAAERHLRSKIVTKLVVWTLSGSARVHGGGRSLRERTESLLSCAISGPVPAAHHESDESEETATDTDKSDVSSFRRRGSTRFSGVEGNCGDSHLLPPYPGTTTEEDESSLSSLGRGFRYLHDRRWIRQVDESGLLMTRDIDGDADERRDDCDTVAIPSQQRAVSSYDAANAAPTATLRFSVDCSEASDLRSAIADKVSELVLLELHSNQPVSGSTLEQPSGVSVRTVHVEVKLHEPEVDEPEGPGVADGSDAARSLFVPQRPQESTIAVVAADQQLEAPSKAGAQWRRWWWSELHPLDPEKKDNHNMPYFAFFKCPSCIGW
jgi:hypothetical protein